MSDAYNTCIENLKLIISRCNYFMISRNYTSIGHKNKEQIYHKWKSSGRRSWIKCWYTFLKRLKSWRGEMFPLNRSTVQMENKRMFSSFILWLNVKNILLKYTIKIHYLILQYCLWTQEISPLAVIDDLFCLFVSML